MKVLENNFKLNFKNNSFNFYNASDGIIPFIISEILQNKKKIVIALSDNKYLKPFAKTLSAITGINNILIFPSWDCFPYSDVSPSNYNINIRFKVLTEILFQKNDYKIIITNFKNLTMLLPNKGEVISNIFYLEKNKEYNLKDTINTLSSRGYNHVNLVLEPNEYAIRGGIIDIWPVGEQAPVRLDFFGDTLESIKLFDPMSQISKKEKYSISIFQNIEPPLSDTSKNDFISNYRNYFGPSSNKDLFIHQLKEDKKLDGIEHWMPLFYKKKFISFFDFFNPEYLIFEHNLLNELEIFYKETIDAYSEKKELASSQIESINQPIKPELLYLEQSLLSKQLNLIKKIEFNKFISKKSNNYDLKATDNIEKDIKVNSDEQLFRILQSIVLKRTKKKIIFVADNEKNKEKLIFYIKNLFKNEEFILRTNKSNFTECFDDQEIVDIFIYPLDKGFENNFIKIISFYEIFKVRKTIQSRKFKNNINISDINIYDYIVHNDHGIGKYLGLKAILIDNLPHDCMVIEYLNNAKLYLPVENINLISKYGSSEKNIQLDKLGQNSWNTRKNSVKKKIKDLANSLISIAAKREMARTYKMNVDHIKLQEFARGFKFNETEDQITCLNEVFNDLSSAKPMDRLICGDVGFGKTEIALRASFISSLNNFKVLIIAPTTLLANQHYKNFKERLHNYTNVELITRNTTKSNKSNILKKFESNKSNILIGTHALLSLKFSDINLGLIVVDEEQHFGVAQKEKIRSLKDNVNLLTLTATPIPRTLHMSLLGIRDLSLITTPPVNRQNIRTTVCNFEKGIVRKAIQNEKVRSGQIFLIVPRIRDIEKIIAKLKVIYPNLKLEIVHGKLKSKDIDNAMNNFYSGKCDLLLSTSIVESGLDIPKANTLIVYKADQFGLAQLHQLRGRIGRSIEKGFAYFTLEKKNITKNAERRLKALQAMDSLGAGINLANHDLDIRGAGNLLGEEQSGQIIQVGIELYQKLLKECIDDLKNIKKDFSDDIIINIKLPILIPENYIYDLSLRLSTYRKLGELRSNEDFMLFEEEMINRFGLIPNQFKNLIELVKLKVLAAKTKIIRIDANQEYINVYFNKDFKDYPEEFIKWITKNKNYVKLVDEFKIKIFNNKIIDIENLLLHVYEIVNTINLVLIKKEQI